MTPANTYNKTFIRMMGVFMFGMFAFSTASAHAINYAMEEAAGYQAAWFYLALGFQHIVPDGLDHILFISALCLGNTKLRQVLWQATAFTLAHSVTLALAMKQIIAVDEGLIEPVIALSIAFVAVENLLMKRWNPWRILIVFLFGLVHGLGFASSLNETGLPRNRFLTSIVSFNAGVELGQVLVIGFVYFLLVRPFTKKDVFKKFVLYPMSISIGCIALYWTFIRLM